MRSSFSRVLQILENKSAENGNSTSSLKKKQINKRMCNLVANEMKYRLYLKILYIFVGNISKKMKIVRSPTFLY